MGKKPSEIYKLSKMSKMAVFYSGSQIVSVIRIYINHETRAFTLE